VSVRLSRTSRLAFHELLRDDTGRDFFDLPEYPPLDPQPDDIEYVLEARDRLDLLAQRYYGDVGFQWVIAPLLTGLIYNIIASAIIVKMYRPDS
jgi:chitinase